MTFSSDSLHRVYSEFERRRETGDDCHTEVDRLGGEGGGTRGKGHCVEAVVWRIAERLNG
jgi:hypothetical protein